MDLAIVVTQKLHIINLVDEQQLLMSSTAVNLSDGAARTAALTYPQQCLEMGSVHVYIFYISV